MIKLADAIVFLKANKDGLKRDLDSAQADTGSWVTRVGGSVAGMLGGVVVAGATAAAGAIVGAGVAAFNMAADIDAATTRATRALNLTEAQALAMQGAIRQTWVAVGGDVEEIGRVAEQVFLSMGDAARRMTDTELAGVTKGALAIRDAFDIDVQESMRAAVVMVNNGLVPSYEAAFDAIVAGAQNGVNVSNDLIDTLIEYSDDFARLGLTADQTMTMLNNGLAAGAFNTDKLADALNEFGVNLRDPAIAESLGLIDSGVAGIYQQFQTGEISEQQALFGMLERLQALEDPIARDQAGVLLFRSMWEDLGESAILALGDIESGMIETEGATNTMIEGGRTLGERWGAVWRRILDSLTPVGSYLLTLAEQAMPHVEAAAAWLAERIPVWVASIRSTIETIVTWIMTNVVPRVERAVQDIRDFFQRAATWFEAHILPTVRRIFDIVRSIFNAFRALFEGDWRLFGQYLRQAWDLLWSELSMIFQNIITAISEIDWGQVGSNIVSGIVNGIRNFGSWAVDEARRLGSNILNAARGFLGISSPSKVMAEQVGRPIAEGIAQGMTDAAGSINAAMQDAINIPNSVNVNGLRSAVAGSSGTNVAAINITFNGSAPTTAAEAEHTAALLVDAMRARGLA